MADRDDETDEGGAGEGSGGGFRMRLLTRSAQAVEARRYIESAINTARTEPSAGAPLLHRVDDNLFPLVVYRRKPPIPAEYVIYEHLADGSVEWIADACSKADAMAIIYRIRNSSRPGPTAPP